MQVGVAKEDQPHYLRVLARPGPTRTAAPVRPGRDRRPGAGEHRHEHGVICPVRTYESPLEHRVEAEFGAIATVTLLIKETLVRVAEPALVPAIR